MRTPKPHTDRTVPLPPDARRMTRQRRVVLEEVRSMMGHPSADEVYDRVRKCLPRISLATVYRNLEVLSEQGLIHRIGHCDMQMRFDSDLHPHFHLRCVECGRLADAPIEPCERIEEALRSMSHLEVIGYRLEFLHRCDRCRGRAGRAQAKGDEKANVGGEAKGNAESSGKRGIAGR